MAKIKAVKFHSDFCENGKIKYSAGTVQPLNDDTDRCVALNFGEIVSLDEKKADAIGDIQEEVARIEAELADTPEAEVDARAALQTLLDARREELAKLQPNV